MGAIPTKFRSKFTGQEIDQILASVKTKIDSSIISNDFNGGTDKVASAELAKILHDSLHAFSDPNYITQLILSVSGSNLYTDAEKRKLASLNADFKGVFLTKTDRDNNLNTADYDGGEMCVIRNVGNGLGEIEVWDSVVGAWVRQELYDTGIINALTILLTPSVVVNFDTTKYTTMELSITAKQTIYGTVNIQVIKMIVCSDGSNVYWSTVGNVGNNNSLITVTASSGSPSQIIATGQKGCVVTGKVLAKY